MTKEKGTILKTPLWKILMFYAGATYWWLFMRPVEMRLQKHSEKENGSYKS